ncbi:putative metallocarboxypeptidase ecm14 [Ophidiomyces ophidiicola]|nr:putative metallocarboxypeptidase ecm14 [Ophidiomyces ophidiicola]KAI1988276.1 putative metallocarboxypeptidase ecm14 [Ophidiomyces ophidiicola]KAI1991220.1 putative metallocarboxypeptidase ecm14 [Ophidiomyces ophidiicola]KAI1995717.1 putative metallocarboxypeptidase ecm14 [Ophidiomyces ophidiicola]
MHVLSLITAASLISAPLVVAVPSSGVHEFQSPFDASHSPPPSSLDPSPPRVWTKLRDSIIETIWRVPNSRRRPSGSKSPVLWPEVPSSIRARYGDDIVLRFTIRSESDVNALLEASNTLFLDVWASTNEWVDIRLAKDVVPSLLGLLPASLKSAHVPVLHDLAQAIYESYPQTSTIRDQTRAFSPSIQPDSENQNIFFQDYQPLSVILPWMRLLASMFSSHVRLISLGTSVEGRELMAFRIGAHPSDPSRPVKPRKTIIVTGGTHAREWIGVSTVNYLAYSLITGYGKSKPITTLIEQFDWVLIPTINPDGYVYTWETDRLWRKNRQENDLAFCPGIDLDRTWGFEWNGNDSRSNPCSEDFAGNEPFGGLESKKIAQWALNETTGGNSTLVGFLDLHSYSQQILYPYSYSCAVSPPTLENLQELGLGIAKAIRQTDSQHYDVSPACEGQVEIGHSQKKEKKGATLKRMESAGGSALDWFYHELHVRYTYQIKLRDKGSYGFLLPREEIIPTGKEVYNAALVFGKFLLGKEADTMDWDAEFQFSKQTNSNDAYVQGDILEDGQVDSINEEQEDANNDYLL